MNRREQNRVATTKMQMESIEIVATTTTTMLVPDDGFRRGTKRKRARDDARRKVAVGGYIAIAITIAMAAAITTLVTPKAIDRMTTKDGIENITNLLVVVIVAIDAESTESIPAREERKRAKNEAVGVMITRAILVTTVTITDDRKADATKMTNGVEAVLFVAAPVMVLSIDHPNEVRRGRNQRKSHEMEIVEIAFGRKTKVVLISFVTKKTVARERKTIPATLKSMDDGIVIVIATVAKILATAVIIREILEVYCKRKAKKNKATMIVAWSQ